MADASATIACVRVHLLCIACRSLLGNIEMCCNFRLLAYADEGSASVIKGPYDLLMKYSRV